MIASTVKNGIDRLRNAEISNGEVILLQNKRQIALLTCRQEISYRDMFC